MVRTEDHILRAVNADDRKACGATNDLDQRRLGAPLVMNDEHHRKSRVLRQFAKRFSAYLRASDMPARLAGDSFLVVLTALSSPNDATVVAVRLMLALAQPFGVEGRERSVQCSIGIAEYPRDAEDGVALLTEAFRAADHAQNEGGGRYCSVADLKAK